MNSESQRGLEECQDLDKDAIQKRLEFFEEEIKVLEGRVKFQDTGHIKSAISTIKARKREIERRLEGDAGWFDEYLIGY